MGYLDIAREAIERLETEKAGNPHEVQANTSTQYEINEFNEISARVPMCPTCGQPIVRLGNYVSNDGHGRFHCGKDSCLTLWRRVDDGEAR